MLFKDTIVNDDTFCSSSIAGVFVKDFPVVSEATRFEDGRKIIHQ